MNRRNLFKGLAAVAGSLVLPKTIAEVIETQVIVEPDSPLNIGDRVFMRHVTKIRGFRHGLTQGYGIYVPNAELVCNSVMRVEMAIPTFSFKNDVHGSCEYETDRFSLVSDEDQNRDGLSVLLISGDGKVSYMGRSFEVVESALSHKWGFSFNKPLSVTDRLSPVLPEYTLDFTVKSG